MYLNSGGEVEIFWDNEVSTVVVETMAACLQATKDIIVTS